MSLAQNLIDFLKSSKKEKENTAPKGICPNCWGRTEYSGKFYEAMKNENININDTDGRVGWIQEYANKHLSSLELQPSNEGTVCKSAKSHIQKLTDEIIEKVVRTYRS